MHKVCCWLKNYCWEHFYTNPDDLAYGNEACARGVRVKTWDSLISSLQIPGDTGDHHPERFQQSLRTFLKMKMYQMFKLRTQPSPPFVNVSNKVERCSDKVGASGCCMQSRCHSPLHRKPICEPMS